MQNKQQLQESNDQKRSHQSTEIKSLLALSNYHVGTKKEMNEYEKAYMGKEVGFNKYSLEEMYNPRSVKKETKKTVRQEEKRVDDDWEEMYFGYPTCNPRRDMVLENKINLRQDKKDSAIREDKALVLAEDLVHRLHIKKLGKALWYYNGIFYEVLSEADAQDLVLNTYRDIISKGNVLAIIRNVSSLLMACAEKLQDEFPLNQHLIVFTNGTLELNTGRFRKNSSKDLATSALGIAFDQNSWNMPHTECFLRTLADGDEKLYRRLLQVMGYILSNDTRAKSFFYLEGVSNAGKSRFCDLIASFFTTTGANQVARVPLQDLGGKFSLGNLVNSKLNISEDLPDSPLSNVTVSRIKMLSDGNRLEAEAKFVQAHSFRPTCKLLFASNHSLKLKEYDEAFVNRVVYIPILKAIPKDKQDRNILEKMKNELPAVFNHALRAYLELVESGYSWAGGERFNPSIGIEKTGIVTNKEKELNEFLKTCCIIQENCTTSVADLQAEYNKFCEKRGYSPILGARFSRELRVFLPETVTAVKLKNSCRGYEGIGILKQYPTGDFNEFE